MSRVDEVDTGSDGKAAGSPNEDEAARVGFVESGDEGTGGPDHIVDVSGARSVGADDGIDADGFGGNVVGIEEVSFDDGDGGILGKFGGVAEDGGDVMSAGDELFENAAADHSGGAIEKDVHGESPSGVLKDR
jgi:hypothetical protein